MNDQAARLHNLRQLVLPIVVHGDLRAIQAGGKVVSRRAKRVDDQVPGFWTQAAADKPLSLAVSEQNTMEAGLHDTLDFAPQRIFTLWREAARINDHPLDLIIRVGNAAVKAMEGIAR